MNSSGSGEKTIAATPTEVLRVNNSSYKVIAIAVRNTGANALTGFEVECRAYDWPDPEQDWETVASASADYTDPPPKSTLLAGHNKLPGAPDPATLAAGTSTFLAISLEPYPYLRILATSTNGTQLSYGYTLMGGGD